MDRANRLLSYHEKTVSETNLWHYVMDLSASVFVHVWVCVLLACICMDMYIADCEQECVFYNRHALESEIGFAETDCHQLILCNIPLPVLLIKIT